MAELQWLGTVEKGEDNMSALAKALQGGISGYFTGKQLKEKKEETAITQRLAQSEIDIKQKQLEHDYAKLDYDKRKDMYDTIVKLLPSIQPEKQMELTSSAEWTTLEKSLGVPALSGSTISPEKEKTRPSWGQEQETASIKADLQRGRGSISTLVGEPLEFLIDNEASALDYISKKGRDPAEFASELTKYKTTTPTTKVKGKVKDKYTVGQKMTKDGKTYTYLGNGKWSY